ncbi:MAG: small conductance mechanosensitive channel [Saprospiraceae bacterium]|jgi:small conductance mechanosensitive channel|tara:strand:+ start:287 stop:517 length:231 start_codon:yes stop_codon:yes gene_type:complete
MILFCIRLVGVIAVILSFPWTDESLGQLTSLIRIVISAVLALSSATFIGNALAGVMLRTINNFKPGDFKKVHFIRG